MTFSGFGALLVILGQVVAWPALLHGQLQNDGMVILMEGPGNSEPVCTVPLDPGSTSMDKQLRAIKKVQKKLRKEEAMLEYYFSDTVMFILCISADSISLLRQKVYPCFRRSLLAFRKKLSSADIYDITQLGQKLYSILVSPVITLLSSVNRLIIIPGPELGGIPFEAFVNSGSGKETTHLNENHYLLFDFEIIYNYSADLWSASVNSPESSRIMHLSEPDIAFTGISPVFTNHPSLNPLPGSKHEVNTISTMFRKMGLKSCVLSEEDSQESRFKEVASNSRILHLATHSYRSHKDNTSNGFLFWGFDPSGDKDSDQDGVLTSGEICDLDLKADLIVLNSCSSGLCHTGDEITECQHPLDFLRAGAKNIVSALWNVTDHIAGSFMVGFYRYWFKGLPYSAALRQTKLEMIRNPKTALPTLWAPYILVGQ